MTNNNLLINQLIKDLSENSQTANKGAKADQVFHQNFKPVE